MTQLVKNARIQTFCPTFAIKMSQKPLVTVILPVHNSQEHLTECLDSLLRQTYRNIEIIAIDDKSSDNSLKILKTFRKKDKRLRVYSNVKRYGISMTLNRCIRRAKGQYITFMEGDDFCAARKITKQVRYLAENPGVVAVGSQCTFLNEYGRKIRESAFPDQNRDIYSTPLHGISLQFETILINRLKLPKDVIKFNSASVPFIYTDLLMKILPYGKFANLNDHLYFHRTHPQEYFSDLKRNFFSLIKLWFKSITNYNYTPWSKSFFTPLIKTSK